MSTRKHIIWRTDYDPKHNKDGKVFANIHLLVGYNQGSISDFQKMADELRETFPEATYDQICGGKVYKSHYVDGFTIVTWNAYIPKKTYDGWAELDKADYYW